MPSKLFKSSDFNKKSTPSSKKVTIVLSIMVRNESGNLVRCIKSCIPVIDYACITDTGSTDTTIEETVECCDKMKLPYAIYTTKFINFCESRTESIRNTMKHFPDATYLLLLDADHKLKVDPKFKKNLLTSVRYSFIQIHGSIQYENTRLIKNKMPWKYFTPTHEYIALESEEPVPSSLLKSITIDDVSDGGYKEHKVTRDLHLLCQYVHDNYKEDGSHESDSVYIRVLFYLAQTLRDMDQYDQAAGFYLERGNMKRKWGEETYYSLFQAGVCMDKKYHLINKIENLRKTGPKTAMDQIHLAIYAPFSEEKLRKEKEIALIKAFDYYLRAYESRKIRGESLSCLIKLAYLTSNYDFAYEMALLLVDIKVPSDALFVNRKAHEKTEMIIVDIVSKFSDDDPRIAVGLDYAEKIILSDQFSEEDKQFCIEFSEKHM